MDNTESGFQRKDSRLAHVCFVCLPSQRSFRSTKSPLRSGHHHAKGGSFFHRRLSSKSPNRGAYLSATDIQLDDTSGHDLSSGTDPVHHKVTQCPPSCSKIFLPRSSSNPHQADPSSPSYSTPDPARAPGRERGRTGLGQSLSVDDDIYPLTLAPPELVLPLNEMTRKGSASSEGSTSGRKSPRERLVRKMIQVFK